MSEHNPERRKVLKAIGWTVGVGGGLAGIYGTYLQWKQHNERNSELPIDEEVVQESGNVRRVRVDGRLRYYNLPTRAPLVGGSLRGFPHVGLYFLETRGTSFELVLEGSLWMSSNYDVDGLDRFSFDRIAVLNAHRRNRICSGFDCTLSIEAAGKYINKLISIEIDERQSSGEILNQEQRDEISERFHRMYTFGGFELRLHDRYISTRDRQVVVNIPMEISDYIDTVTVNDDTLIMISGTRRLFPLSACNQSGRCPTQYFDFETENFTIILPISEVRRVTNNLGPETQCNYSIHSEICEDGQR